MSPVLAAQAAGRDDTVTFRLASAALFAALFGCGQGDVNIEVTGARCRCHVLTPCLTGRRLDPLVPVRELGRLVELRRYVWQVDGALTPLPLPDGHLRE